MVTVAEAAVAVVVVHVVHSAGGILLVGEFLLAAGILLAAAEIPLAAEILLAAAAEILLAAAEILRVASEILQVAAGILLAAVETLLAETVESEEESLVGKILLGFDQTEAAVVVVGRTVPEPGTAVVAPVLAAAGRTVESVDH